MNGGELEKIKAALRASEEHRHRLLEEVNRERRRARDAVRRLNEGREEEARRIAHALHDDASQLLSAVHLALAELGRQLSPRTRRNLRKISELLDHVEEHLRRLSHELRPTILDDLGLVPALDRLIDGVSTRSGLRITLIDSISGRLPCPIETALYRSVQEALTNIIKHACATIAKVELRQENGSICCSISDDGIGFETTNSLARREACGLGLSGIRERLYPLRGTLKINSSPGHGTELIISAPLQDSEVQAIPKKVSGLVASQPHPIDAPIDAKGFH